MNRILEKYQNRQPSVGTFTHMRSPVAVEALGTAGLDYVILDTEHCVQNPETLADCITAADAAGLDAVVRINAISREAVLRPLDLGAKGLIVPAVETVEEVERLVRFAKFPPLGNRGFCPTRDRRVPGPHRTDRRHRGCGRYFRGPSGPVHRPGLSHGTGLPPDAGGTGAGSGRLQGGGQTDHDLLRRHRRGQGAAGRGL